MGSIALLLCLIGFVLSDAQGQFYSITACRY